MGDVCMEVYVARQPIFNDKEEVFAYELLYRGDQMNAFPNINGDQATTEVIINSFLNIGIDELSNGKPCFINFTMHLLQMRLPTYFNPRDIVIEILETIKPSFQLIQICKELKFLGYQIALDDFILDEGNQYIQELLDYVDYIKVDFMTSTREMRKKIETLAQLRNIKLLAEKVETREEFEHARLAGYSFFQGYFFEKPSVVSTLDVPTYFHSYYSIIQNLSMTEPQIDKIAEIIEQDISLSYKLLKLINSPAYRPRNKINSIRQAIVLLGLIEIEKWIYVLAVREASTKTDSVSVEKIRIALTRAKSCESISSILGSGQLSSSFFLTGMFSMMDSILGVPMEKVLKDLPLQEEICNALQGKENTYRDVLELVIMMEKAMWTEVRDQSDKLRLSEEQVLKMYGNSLNWSNQLLSKEEN